MKNFNKSLMQKYFLLFFADMLLFYAYLFLSLKIVYDMDIRTSSYAGLSAVAGWYGYKLKLDIKRTTNKINKLFIFFVFIMGCIVYSYYFDKYNLEIFKMENWSFPIIFIMYFWAHIDFRHKTVEELEKRINFNFWEFIKR